MIRLSHPVPVYVICGWLGAGKTTLLVRLLEYWRARGCRVGVLMNEAGGYDQQVCRADLLACCTHQPVSHKEINADRYNE